MPGCVRGCYEPIVGIVVTISPSFSLYRIVVFPAASRPTIRILISFLPHRRSNSLEKVRPMLAVVCDVRLGGVCVWKVEERDQVVCPVQREWPGQHMYCGMRAPGSHVRVLYKGVK